MLNKKLINLAQNIYNMEETSNEKQKDQVSQSTMTTKTEPTLWERLQQMPYSRDRIGQGFVIGLSSPKSETKPSKDAKK
jgi:hypothetical protein